MSLLSIVDVAKRYGGVSALDGVALEIGEGEVVGLIGPNGAGKTTLLNVICGYTRADSGQIHFAGKRIVNLPPHRISVLGIGRTFQGARAFVNLTVAENLALVGRLQGIPSKAASSASLDLLERSGLSMQMNTRVKSLPYGLRSLLGLALALRINPKLLILDEPVAGLNHEEGNLVQEVTLARRRVGCSVLLVEHRVDVVMSTCDRVVVLNYGRKLAEGTPEYIQEHPDVISAYLGGPIHA